MALHPAIKELLNEIDAFRDEHSISASAFGASAVNDPNLIGDLRRGRMPSFSLVDRVRAFMAHGKHTRRIK